LACLQVKNIHALAQLKDGNKKETMKKAAADKKKNPFAKTK
jgi:hypothetical protein